MTETPSIQRSFDVIIPKMQRSELPDGGVEANITLNYEIDADGNGGNNGHSWYASVDYAETDDPDCGVNEAATGDTAQEALANLVEKLEWA